MEMLTRKPTALYIGSPYDSRLFVARMIVAAGFELVMVHHNENIFERLEKSPHLDLVVIDSYLIGVDGENPIECFEYYIQVKGISTIQDTPLIIITKENEFDKTLLNKFEADRHIVKPIDIDEFDKILRAYLPKDNS